MQEAMTELITNKNYSEVERLLHVADKLMVDLIEDMDRRPIRFMDVRSFPALAVTREAEKDWGR